MAASAADTDVEQLKQELQKEIDAKVNAVKAEYETKIDNLEKRVDTLESENTQLKKDAKTAKAGGVKGESSGNESAEVASLKQRVSEVELAVQRPNQVATATSKQAAANADAIQKINEDLRSDLTETRDIYRDQGDWPFDVNKLYDLARPFEFHGYLRSGFGMNGDGGKMEAFQAPGAGAKFRLGNEADTYGELTLTNNWLRLDNPSLKPYVRTTVTVSYSTSENFSFDSLNNEVNKGNDFALREAYVEGGNVFQSAPDIKFWAGQRYYQRHDIHIDDFYYLDMSGYGAGVEDIPVGDIGKLQLAWIGGSVDRYVTQHGDAAKQNFDIRLTDVKAPYGNLTFWLDYSYVQGGNVRNATNPDGTPIDIQSTSGWAVGLIHRTPEESLLGGYNDFSILYGRGAAYNFASTLDSAGPNLNDAWRFRTTDTFTIQPSPNFAMQALALYEETNYGGPDMKNRWASVGMRPVYFFNDRFSIALETGVDWTHSEQLHTDGELWKITLAPQLSRGQKFFSRPVIRAFVTYAGWTNGFKGHVGGPAYENDTSGLSYGVQVEAWW